MRWVAAVLGAVLLSAGGASVQAQEGSRYFPGIPYTRDELWRMPYTESMRYMDTLPSMGQEFDYLLWMLAEKMSTEQEIWADHLVRRHGQAAFDEAVRRIDGLKFSQNGDGGGLESTHFWLLLHVIAASILDSDFEPTGQGEAATVIENKIIELLTVSERYIGLYVRLGTNIIDWVRHGTHRYISDTELRQRYTRLGVPGLPGKGK